MAHDKIREKRIIKHYDEVQEALCDEASDFASIQLWQEFDRLPGLTPIEQLMFLELYAFVCRSLFGGIKLEVQKQLGKYRVDFLLTGFAPLLKDIVIECDGHDYHERTKEQAKRDRVMDREIQSLGYKIFRFTGSEIWKSPSDCVQCLYDEEDVLRQKKWRGELQFLGSNPIKL